MDASINPSVLYRLLDLHSRGQVTRRELERAFGLPYADLQALAYGTYQTEAVS